MAKTKTLNENIEELAGVIADQASAIAAGTHAGNRRSAVARLVNNVDTLQAWTRIEAEEVAPMNH